MSITTRENLLHVRYEHDEKTSSVNNMGMRDMQARAFEKRNSQYLLIKAPPACGKSRALMYLALDKVMHQGLDKVIIAVPQMAIGSSFADTNLTDAGFFADWKIDSKYNLCLPGSEARKAQRVLQFMQDPDAHYLVCSHPTLIYFYDKVKDKTLLDRTLVAVDEFHHVSAESENRLGSVIHSLLTDTSAHIVAMTGSYFRGDRVPVLDPSDEQHFDKVTYTYYEQLCSYKYLKSLSIDYAFYDGIWTEAVAEILEPDKKSIIHIPSVNSRESTKDKYNEIGAVFDALGTTIAQDPDSGIYHIQRADGTILKVADLVTDIDNEQRMNTLKYLREHQERDAVDIIVALGMAKEGFDWPWCEYALTVGYRNSLTEVVQIIGRATRDAPGKSHAQFTNLIAKPEAMQEEVGNAVNSLLKAITLSLLMEQVLAPNVHFRTRVTEETEQKTGITVTIKDESVPLSPAAQSILDNDATDIITRLLNESDVVKSALVKDNPDVNQQLSEVEIPLLLKEMYPNIELSDEDIDFISRAVVSTLKINSLYEQSGSNDTTQDDPQPDNPQGQNQGDSDSSKGNGSSGNSPSAEIDKDNRKFLKAARNFINLDDLDLDLITNVNPFRGAYEFLSRSIDPPTLRFIQDKVMSQRSKMTEQEAVLLWPEVVNFKKKYGREPSPNASSDFEQRLGLALAYVRTRLSEKKAAEKKAVQNNDAGA